MSDVEEFSHAAKLGGLRSLVIDRFVAHEAAVNCVGPPNDKKALEHFVRSFQDFLKQAGDNRSDRELRRRVLLMATDGRSAMSASNDDASRVRRVVDDIYKSIA